MTLKEETRLELMRLTMKFAADNFSIEKGGIETTRALRDCYLVLAEGLSGNGLSSIFRKIWKRIFRSGQRTCPSPRICDENICFLKQLIGIEGEIIPSQKVCQSDNSSYTLKTRDINTHSSSPKIDDTRVTDSTSETRDGESHHKNEATVSTNGGFNDT